MKKYLTLVNKFKNIKFYSNKCKKYYDDEIKSTKTTIFVLKSGVAFICSASLFISSKGIIPIGMIFVPKMIDTIYDENKKLNNLMNKKRLNDLMNKKN